MSESKHTQWEVVAKDMGLGHLIYGVVVKDTPKVIIEDLTLEEATLIVNRWNSQPALLEACKESLGPLYFASEKTGNKTSLKLVQAAISLVEKEG